MGNPSWISAHDLGLFEDLLEIEWPAPDPVTGGTITVGQGGATYGDPATNRLVEHAAVDEATRHYESMGYTVEDVGSRKLGWDLTCRSRRDGVRRVEVKGVAGDGPAVLLTRNEVRSAQEDDGWELAVVTQAPD